MKPLSLLPFCSLIAATALTAAGQAETKNTAKDPASPTGEAAAGVLRSTGITFSVDEEALLVAPENVKIPLNFVRTTATPVVDDTGKEVAWEQIRAGIPITVHYTMLGEKMVATKVVVSRYMLDGSKEVAATDDDGQKRIELARMKRIKDAETAVQTKTQPATGGGTIMGFEQVIAIGDGNGGDVTQYVVNNSTQYITSGGKPVALGLVRTGVRVDVKYVENSGRKIATQIVLHGVPAQGTALNSGTTTTTGSAQNTGNSTATTGTTTTTTGLAGGTNTAWVDQFGNIIPGTLETGFINPPVSVLPSNFRPGTTTGTLAGNTGTAVNNNNGTGVNNQPVQPNTNQPTTDQPGTNQPNTNQPGTSQPNTNQPGTNRPGNTRPNTTQPGTRQPATRPATSSPSTSPAPAPAPAPGGR